MGAYLLVPGRHIITTATEREYGTDGLIRVFKVYADTAGALRVD